MQSLLLIEDNPIIGSMTETVLKSAYKVEWVQSAEAAAQKLQSRTHYDLLILDVNLPGMSGFDFLRQMREGGQDYPVLMLTVHNSVDNRVEGLNAGADDYVCKPYNPDELLVRVATLLRRVGGSTQHIITHGDMRYDTAFCSVEKAGVPISLSAREAAVLDILMANIGRIISKTQIEDFVYGRAGSDQAQSNAIEVHVSSLRRKLGHGVIRTVRGLGYTIPTEVDMDAIDSEDEIPAPHKTGLADPAE